LRAVAAGPELRAEQSRRLMRTETRHDNGSLGPRTGGARGTSYARECCGQSDECGRRTRKEARNVRRDATRTQRLQRHRDVKPSYAEVRPSGDVCTAASTSHAHLVAPPAPHICPSRA
jgi:hypothetical protein